MTLSSLALVSVVLWQGQATGRTWAVPGDEYERTSRALEQYRLLAAQDDGGLLPGNDVPVEPGESYAGTPRLIELLTLLGDLPADRVPAEDSGVYQGELVTAVKRFQVRHGLEPNGRIDRATLEQLNTPLSVRVRQLELALERWRRCPYDPARPAIVLNLPEFRLRAFGGFKGGDDPELEMKVIVGQAAGHQSPILRSHIDTVIFRPYWNVPVSIQHNELLAEIQKDPMWVRANNFEMVTAQGEVAGDGRVSEEMFEELSTGRLQLRQKPGPKNTLGLVKFLFPNQYGVYMHDTSARSLFAQTRRDLSHGCIRVEKPEALAAWILREQPGWSRERVMEAIHGQDSVSVTVVRPIQVVTMYLTAVVMKNGEVHFFQDIYGEDQDFEREVVAQRK
jgi:murein L,D-transpeptidase YcbB/YkuD